MAAGCKRGDSCIMVFILLSSHVLNGNLCQRCSQSSSKTYPGYPSHPTCFFWLFSLTSCANQPFSLTQKHFPTFRCASAGMAYCQGLRAPVRLWCTTCARRFQRLGWSCAWRWAIDITPTKSYKKIGGQNRGNQDKPSSCLGYSVIRQHPLQHPWLRGAGREWSSGRGIIP